MFRFKLLLVSCLVFNLSGWSDGKTLNCSIEKNWRGNYCIFVQVELNSGEEASFSVSNFGPGETPTPANITNVYFYSSSIYYVPASIFTYFTKLRWLRLDDCNVQEIRNNTFENATELQEIDLAGNKISTLEADTFRGATSLESINLSNNQIFTHRSKCIQRSSKSTCSQFGLQQNRRIGWQNLNATGTECTRLPWIWRQLYQNSQ